MCVSILLSALMATLSTSGGGEHVMGGKPRMRRKAGSSLNSLCWYPGAIWENLELETAQKNLNRKDDGKNIIKHDEMWI